MQFDPTATFSSNLAVETSRGVLQYTRKKKETGISLANKHAIKTRAEEKKKEEAESPDGVRNESACDSPVENGIIFTFDPFVSNIIQIHFFYYPKHRLFSRFTMPMPIAFTTFCITSTKALTVTFRLLTNILRSLTSKTLLVFPRECTASYLKKLK